MKKMQCCYVLSISYSYIIQFKTSVKLLLNYQIQKLLESKSQAVYPSTTNSIKKSCNLPFLH